jgi:hypothetical protein
MVPASAITLTPGASSSSSNTISNGDPVYVTGVATGHPRDGLQVWLIGYNTVKITTVAVNDDNSYSWELKSTDTKNLASGQYLVIVQHPMMNGQFDIYYSPSTGQVINRQLGISGTSIFQLTSGGSLQSTDAANALMRAINNQNIDDTFTTASFYISPPDAFVSPVGDHVVGEKFTISGSTNLAVGDKLEVNVYSSSFAPTQKSQTGEFSGASGVVEVTSGGSNGRNRWSFDVDAAGFKPDEYIITVSGIIQEVHGSATFNIVQELPTPAHIATSAMTTGPVAESTPVSAIAATPTRIPATLHSPLSLWISAGALLGIIIVMHKRRD